MVWYIEMHPSCEKGELTMVKPDDLTEVHKQMGLSDWDIRYKSTQSKELHGEVEAVPEYERITVYVHPKSDDFIGTVIHELVHGLLWEFSALANMLAETDAELECLRVAEERFVNHIEQMPVWDKLKEQYRE